jgi:hypothetical protein
MNRPAIRIAVLVVGCLFVAACVSSGPRTQISARLVPGQRVEVEGKTVAFDRLAARLRACGAGPDTAVIVAVPPETPEAVMARIVQELARGGLRRVAFVRPRHAEAAVGSPPAASR